MVLVLETRKRQNGGAHGVSSRSFRELQRVQGSGNVWQGGRPPGKVLRGHFVKRPLWRSLECGEEPKRLEMLES